MSDDGRSDADDDYGCGRTKRATKTEKEVATVTMAAKCNHFGKYLVAVYPLNIFARACFVGIWAGNRENQKNSLLPRFHSYTHLLGVLVDERDRIKGKSVPKIVSLYRMHS